MAFSYEEIIREKQIIIENLVTWIWEHCPSEDEFKDALRKCNIPEEDIEGYCD